MSLNNFSVQGNLTEDPKIVSYKNEEGEELDMVSFKIAHNHFPSKKKKTSFFDVACYRGFPKTMAQKLKKGDLTTLTGELEVEVVEKDDKVYKNVRIKAAYVSVPYKGKKEE